MTNKYKYEIRKVEALAEEVDENGIIWTWNNSIHICNIYTNAKDHATAFRRWLERQGIRVNRDHDLYIDYDGSVYELKSISDDEPLCAMIPSY